MPEQFVLLTPVYSYLRPSTIYGNVGDRVTLIKDMGSCLIVENKKGDRFPISHKKLTAAKIDLKPEPAKKETVQQRVVHKHQKNLF